METEILNILLMLVAGLAAGLFGSLMGLGGAIISTPILVLVLGVDIKLAIASGLIVVIATSSGSTISFLKDSILNLRAAMFLEIFTSIGGIIGAFITSIVAPFVLYAIHGTLMLYTGCDMGYKVFIKKQKDEDRKLAKPDKLANKLGFSGQYYDQSINKTIKYNCKNVPGGSAMMLFAGIVSGTLGVGSGPFKVIALDYIMKMPLKVSTSTSNLMMGVTACTSALIYFFHGMINPLIAAPLAIGVLGGATIGGRIMPKINPTLLRKIFVPVVMLVGINMYLRAFGIGLV